MSRNNIRLAPEVNATALLGPRLGRRDKRSDGNEQRDHDECKARGHPSRALMNDLPMARRQAEQNEMGAQNYLSLYHSPRTTASKPRFVSREGDLGHQPR